MQRRPYDLSHWWLPGVLLLAGPAGSDEPAAVSGLPDPEIAWIVENSAIEPGISAEIRLSFEGPEPPLADIRRPDLDLGIDLQWSRRVLEGATPIEPVKPESLVGL